MAEDFRFARTDHVRLVKRLELISRPKTAFTTYHYSEQLSEADVKEAISTLDGAFFDIVLLHIKRRGPALGQLGVLRSAHRATSQLLYKFCYYDVNARPERQQHDTSCSRRHVKGLIMSMNTFDRARPTTKLIILFRFVEKSDL